MKGLKVNQPIWTVECQYQRSETNECSNFLIKISRPDVWSWRQYCWPVVPPSTFHRILSLSYREDGETRTAYNSQQCGELSQNLTPRPPSPIIIIIDHWKYFVKYFQNSISVLNSSKIYSFHKSLLSSKWKVSKAAWAKI